MLNPARRVNLRHRPIPSSRTTGSPTDCNGAAKALGLDLEVFPLNSGQRDSYLEGRLSLGDDLATTLADSLRRKSFLGNLEVASSEMREKLSDPQLR